MNILFITSKYPQSLEEPIVSGEIKNPFYLSQELAKKGHNIYVVCHNNETNTYELNGVNIYSIGSGYMAGILKTASKNIQQIPICRKIALEHSIDITHIATNTSAAGIALTANLNLLNTPVVTTPYGTDVPEMQANLISSEFRDKLNYAQAILKHQFIDKVSWKYSDGIIAIGEYQKQELTELYNINPDRIQLIPNGVKTDIYKPDFESRSAKRKELGIDTDTKVILFVGRMVWKKGIQILVDAAENIITSQSNIEIIVIGGSNEKARHRSRIQKKIAESKHSDKINLMMNIPESKLNDFYTAADVFVAPSIGYETEPTVIYEAMSAGLPIVATNRWGIPYQIGNSKTLVEEKNPSDLARKISTLLLDPDLYEKVSEQNRKRAVSKFDWSEIADRHIQYYEHIINKHI